MPILGITGGIATGKSSLAKLLAHQTGASLFDADACARDLLDNDPDVIQTLRAAFGDSVITEAGAPDRAHIRQIVFEDESKRRTLEGILHPMIRNRWTSLAEKARLSGAWLVIDIPLLFETGVEACFDTIVTVACQTSTQMARLLQLRRLEAAMAEKIVAAQMDMHSKILKAHHLVWNDGPLVLLEAQALLLANYLKQRHG